MAFALMGREHSTILFRGAEKTWSKRPLAHAFAKTALMDHT